MPGGEGGFAERVDRIAAVVARPGATRIELASQWQVVDRAELARLLDGVVGAPMLHLASAPHLAGRSDVLLKLKPDLDAEALAVGHQPGLSGLAVESPRPALLHRQRRE